MVDRYHFAWSPGQPLPELGPTGAQGFEVLFAPHGPEKPFFDKVWKLPDIEAVK